jgi:hypothetical protein
MALSPRRCPLNLMRLRGCHYHLQEEAALGCCSLLWKAPSVLPSDVCAVAVVGDRCWPSQDRGFVLEPPLLWQGSQGLYPKESHFLNRPASRPHGLAPALPHMSSGIKTRVFPEAGSATQLGSYRCTLNSSAVTHCVTLGKFYYLPGLGISFAN